MTLYCILSQDLLQGIQIFSKKFFCLEILTFELFKKDTGGRSPDKLGINHHSASTTLRQALIILTSSPRIGELWLPHCIMDLLRHVYQRALLEHQARFWIRIDFMRIRIRIQHFF